jgi:hypothetical protein
MSMTPEVLAIVNTVGLAIVALITYLGNRQTHKIVNSRMTEMLELAKRNWRDGKVEEEERMKAKKG